MVGQERHSLRINRSAALQFTKLLGQNTRTHICLEAHARPGQSLYLPLYGQAGASSPSRTKAGIFRYTFNWGWSPDRGTFSVNISYLQYGFLGHWKGYSWCDDDYKQTQWYITSLPSFTILYTIPL